MFSKEFMRYLINYQPDGCEVNQKKEQVKEIEFKQTPNKEFAKVYLAIKR